MIYFKKKKIIKINNINKISFDSVKFRGTDNFPAPKFFIVGKHSKQKVPFLDDRIQPTLRSENAWIKCNEVLINEI